VTRRPYSCNPPRSGLPSCIPDVPLYFGVAKLFIVSTPIGNLGDLSPRAAESLRTSDRILAEDTRRTRVLVDRASSHAPLVSLHAHNEAERVRQVLAWLDAGETLTLVSDAGTPLVSDPGGRLVNAVASAGHTVVPVPGPSAVLAALVASGLPTDRFTFLGFPERKGRLRAELLDRVRTSADTVVLFESPHRLVKLLDELSVACGADRRVAVARELTKLHEEVRRGTLEEVAGYYRGHPPRGEVTVVVAPDESGPDESRLRARAESLARELLDEGRKPSDVAREVSGRLALPKNTVYAIVQQIAHD
jgi:16S rRNA (cytidine1402-2'-O)-methyltransferase